MGLMRLQLDSFRALADASANGWLVHEAKSKKIIWASRRACESFKYTVEELQALKAHHMSSRDPRYRRELGIAWLQTAVLSGRDRRIWKYQDRNGEDFLTDAVATYVELDGQNPVILVEFRILRDTDVVPQPSKWVEDSLDRLMKYTSSAILLLDKENRVQDASPLAARLFGQTVAEVLNKNLDELGPTDLDLSSEQVKAELMKPDGSVNIRFKVTNRHGVLRWLAGHLDNVVVEGDYLRVLTVRDISGKVEWERRNAYQEANLQYLSRYNAMGDMAMILAHDLGQPIAAATNYLGGVDKMLAGGADDRARISYGILQAKKQLQRVADIVSAVKKYVRRIESTSSRINLNDSVEESLYFVRLRAEEKGVVVVSELFPDAIPVNGESVLIGQVIINICMNALEEIVLPTTEAKILEVQTEMKEGSASVLVSDRGRGMSHLPADLLAAGAFSSKEDGSGIGLIISEHIVQRHGGEICYEKRTGGGTTVRIKLPRS